MNEKIINFKKKPNPEKDKRNMNANEILNPYLKIKRLIDKEGSKFNRSLTPSEFSGLGGLNLENTEVDQNEALARGYKFEQEVISNLTTESK